MPAHHPRPPPHPRSQQETSPLRRRLPRRHDGRSRRHGRRLAPHRAARGPARPRLRPRAADRAHRQARPARHHAERRPHPLAGRRLALGADQPRRLRPPPGPVLHPVSVRRGAESRRRRGAAARPAGESRQGLRPAERPPAKRPSRRSSPPAVPAVAAWSNGSPTPRWPTPSGWKSSAIRRRISSSPTASMPHPKTSGGRQRAHAAAPGSARESSLHQRQVDAAPADDQSCESRPPAGGKPARTQPLSAPEGRRHVARGASPWIQRQRTSKPQRGDIAPAFPPSRIRNLRPSGSIRSFASRTTIGARIPSQRILSPKMRFATKFNGDDKPSQSGERPSPAPDQSISPLNPVSLNPPRPTAATTNN